MGSFNFPKMQKDITDDPATAVRGIGRAVWDIANKCLRIFDGTTSGGIVLANQTNLDAVEAAAPKLAADNAFSGSNSFSKPVSVATATGDGHAMNRAAADSRYLQLSGGSITGGLSVSDAPVDDTDVARKADLDDVVSGVHSAAGGPVDAVQTTALPDYAYDNGTSGVGATLTASVVGAVDAAYFDDIDPVVGGRILIISEGAYNGIYEWTTLGDDSTAFVLTRATDADSSSELGGLQVYVNAGSVNKGFSYRVSEASSDITVGTTELHITKSGDMSAVAEAVEQNTSDIAELHGTDSSIIEDNHVRYLYRKKVSAGTSDSALRSGFAAMSDGSASFAGNLLDLGVNRYHGRQKVRSAKADFYNYASVTELPDGRIYAPRVIRPSVVHMSGDYAVYIRYDDDGFPQLYSFNSATGVEVALGFSGYQNAAPVLSDDQTYVIWSSNYNGSWDLWWIPVDGGTAHKALPLSGIACFGDSMTAGVGYEMGEGGIEGGYVGALAETYGWSTYNNGYGGRDMQQISAAYGGTEVTLTLSDNTILSAGASTVSAINIDICGQSVGVHAAASMRGKIAANSGSYVTGTLTSDSDGNYTFTADGLSVSTTCAAGVTFIPEKSGFYRSCTLLLGGGTNSINSDWSTDIALTEAQISNLINAQSCAPCFRHFIVWSPFNGPYGSDTDSYGRTVAIEAWLESTYGDNFFNIRKYIVTNGLSDAGLTATDDDAADIALDIIPRQLRMSEGSPHLTGPGYNVWAAKANSLLTARGWSK